MKQWNRKGLSLLLALGMLLTLLPLPAYALEAESLEEEEITVQEERILPEEESAEVPMQWPEEEPAETAEEPSAEEPAQVAEEEAMEEAAEAVAEEAVETPSEEAAEEEPSQEPAPKPAVEDPDAEEAELVEEGIAPAADPTYTVRCPGKLYRVNVRSDIAQTYTVTCADAEFDYTQSEIQLDENGKYLTVFDFRVYTQGVHNVYMKGDTDGKLYKFSGDFHHTYDDGVIVTPPTETTPGVVRYTCTVCKHVEEYSGPAALTAKVSTVPNSKSTDVLAPTDEITLTWPECPGVTTYRVERQAGEGEWVFAGTVAADPEKEEATWSDYSPALYVTYRYRVFVENESGTVSAVHSPVAELYYPSGTCGTDVRWRMEEGILLFTGSGPMDEDLYQADDNPTPWYVFLVRGRIRSAIIGEGITSVLPYAFQNGVGLHQVTLPGTLEEIGAYAFTDCVGLTSLTLPEGLESIGKSAFRGCVGLQELTLPDSVTFVGNNAFDGCTGITQLSLGEGLTTIGNSAFYNCDGLTSLTLPDSVSKIGMQAFRSCDALREVTAGSGLTEVGAYAFAYCPKLEQVSFRGDAPVFGQKVFQQDALSAFYPAAASGWTQGVLSANYGGTVTWQAACEEHHFVTVEESVPPTCTESGLTLQVVRCSVCAMEQSRTPISSGESALGHDWESSVVEPGCFTSGYTLFVCKRCGEEKQENITKPGHKLTYHPRVEATYLAPGYVDYWECSVCGRMFWDEHGQIEMEALMQEDRLMQTDLKECTLTLGYDTTTYSGSAKKPTVLVETEWEKVPSNYYTVTYTNNTNAGTAKVTVTAKEGNIPYKGSISASFTIAKASPKLTLTADRTAAGIGGKIRLTATTTGESKLTYSGNNSAVAGVGSTGIVTGKSAGTVTVTVSSAASANYNAASKTVKLTFRKLDQPVITTVASAKGGVQVKWNSVADAEQYRVFRKVGSGSWVNVGESKGTSFLDTTAVSNTSYQYAVRCLNEAGSVYSSDLSAGVSLNYIAAPVLKSVTCLSGGVQVKWDAVSGAAQYRVFRKVGSGSWVKLADTKSTDYTDTSVVSGTAYSYTVRCINANGTAFTGSYDTAGLKITYCTAPVLGDVSCANGGVQVKWSAVTGAERYRVFRKTLGGSWTKVADTTAVSYLDKSAVSNTDYIYTVRCVSADGAVYTSSYDGAGKAVHYIAAPVISSVSKVTSGVQIRWSAVEGAEKYRVFRKLPGGSWTRLADTKALVLTDKTAVKGETYVYTVRCVSADGTTYTSGYNYNGTSILVP